MFIINLNVYNVYYINQYDLPVLLFLSILFNELILRNEFSKCVFRKRKINFLNLRLFIFISRYESAK